MNLDYRSKKVNRFLLGFAPVAALSSSTFGVLFPEYIVSNSGWKVHLEIEGVNVNRCLPSKPFFLN